MNPRYDHRTTEARWQRTWEDTGIYRSTVDWTRPKHYAITMLPYPSGDLHIGHWYAMTPSDARARYMRMKGYNVLFPMGFDAFGLPAENAAVQANIHPWTWTCANIERDAAPVAIDGHDDRLVPGGGLLHPSTTDGPNGSSPGATRPDSPTGERRWSTGRPPSRRCSPTSRSSTARTSGPASPWCSG